MDKQDEILIKIISEGEEQLISTCKNEYRSLMVLIKDKLYPDGFGECGGLGRCATCIVRLEKEITGMERNESTTLSKPHQDNHLSHAWDVAPVIYFLIRPVFLPTAFLPYAEIKPFLQNEYDYPVYRLIY